MHLSPVTEMPLRLGLLCVAYHPPANGILTIKIILQFYASAQRTDFGLATLVEVVLTGLDVVRVRTLELNTAPNRSGDEANKMGLALC